MPRGLRCFVFVRGSLCEESSPDRAGVQGLLSRNDSVPEPG